MSKKLSMENCGSVCVGEKRKHEDVLKFCTHRWMGGSLTHAASDTFCLRKYSARAAISGMLVYDGLLSCTVRGLKACGCRKENKLKELRKDC